MSGPKSCRRCTTRCRKLSYSQAESLHRHGWSVLPQSNHTGSRWLTHAAGCVSR